MEKQSHSLAGASDASEGSYHYRGWDQGDDETAWQEAALVDGRPQHSARFWEVRLAAPTKESA